MKSMYKLRGVVQPYSWGGTDFIPQLLNIINHDKKPFAEYWLGAHPNAPAILDETNTSLHQFIASHPKETLGENVAVKFGSLPYLFKILDVKQMLSIQVHPSKAVAEEEFEKENKKGIALNASNRNYKDKNHKPELMVALSDFWLLHGFKPEVELKETLNGVEELRPLLPVFEQRGYKGLYGDVMTMPQEKVDEVLRPLVQKILPLYESGELQKTSEDFWAARAVLTFCKNDSYDRGIFSIYFFNLLHLSEGEAIYQAAGLPHAYLEGQNVEVMANSDNVLRAGLTDKHVDVPELMKHVKFEATHPKIIRASNAAEQAFDAPVEEFFLKRYKTGNVVSLSPKNGTVLFVYEGEAKAKANEDAVELKRGEALFLPPGNKISVSALSGELTFYTVAAALDKK
ncbi:mannose-6-phosphate isomerase, class I [Flavisolibacter ginsenosidimutans]|uniref:mannose-6-phosphate isomerase n=1 Tax=Flavisolibacter ginsenosidimutans TaxID=661481 RepID=A0A5B8UHE5_9BACT|nr:mannose-6-phosphate isomerase, class I [Flavisolibacter ginsenosidimutans]QEC55756.1 mannose-6-phosphate isomerase, class I [Flavisolibacter ginsenosidimutans]